MKITTKKLSERGRPRSRAQTELVAAMVARYDAGSRRTAKKIREILSTHVRMDAARYFWWHRVEQAYQRMHGKFLSDMVALAGAKYEAPIRDFLQEAFDELGPHPAEPPPRPLPDRYPLIAPPLTMRPSRSLAAARARKARLETQRIDLVALITNDPGRLDLAQPTLRIDGSKTTKRARSDIARRARE